MNSHVPGPLEMAQLIEAAKWLVLTLAATFVLTMYLTFGKRG